MRISVSCIPGYNWKVQSLLLQGTAHYGLLLQGTAQYGAGRNFRLRLNCSLIHKFPRGGGLAYSKKVLVG